MTTLKTADKRLFDADGVLVAGIGQPIPEDAKGLGDPDLTPADPAFPAGAPTDAEPDALDPAKPASKKA